MDTGVDVLGSGSGPGMANKRKVVTSKAANNTNGRANSSWGLVQTLADKKRSRKACFYSANDRACPRNDCSYEHGQQSEPPPPPPPPPLSQPQQQQQQPQHNSGAPPAARSFGNGGLARFSYHHAGRGTTDGRRGRGGGREPGNGAAGGRGTEGPGWWYGPRCSAGSTRGNSEVGTSSFFSDARMPVVPDGVP